MNKHIEYKTSGTCSRMISIDIEDGIIIECRFSGGCSGNTAGISALVKGMAIEEAVSRLKGIKCGFKNTSCPDQLAKALETVINN